MRPEDKTRLDQSLADAQKIARRLSRCASSESRDAALELIRKLTKLGATNKE